MNNNEVMNLLTEINKKYNKIYPYKRFIGKDEYTELINKINIYSLDKTLDNLIRLCVCIFNMQIFTDGNSRTVFDFFDMNLNQIGYKIELDKVRDEYKYLRNFFPTIYFPLKENISVSDMNKIKSYIKREDVRSDNSNIRTNRGR